MCVYVEVCMCCSVTKLCPTFCDPMDCSMPGLPVLHCFLEFAQVHVHWSGDAIQPSHPLSPSSLHTHISIHMCMYTHMGFLGGSAVKNPPELQNTQKTLWVRSLGQDDPLEEGMATQSSILALKNPMDRGVWQATAHRVTQSWTQLKGLSTHIHIHNISILCICMSVCMCRCAYDVVFPYILRQSWKVPWRAT